MSKYFIVKPLAIIRGKRLTPLEQDYLCLIAQLQKAGGCTASNNYFARYFGTSRLRAVGVITSLRKKGFISSSEKKQGGKTTERTIWITDSVSKEFLLLVSLKKHTGLVRKSDFDSTESAYHTIDTTTDKTETVSLKKSSSRIDWQAISKYNAEIEKAKQR